MSGLTLCIYAFRFKVFSNLALSVNGGTSGREFQMHYTISVPESSEHEFAFYSFIFYK